MNDEQLSAAPPDIVARANARSRSVAARSERVALTLTFAGVVLPLVCFAISFPGRPEWQSGNTSDYAQLLLSRKCSAPMYPFLLYCMTCMFLVVWQPARFANRFCVRMGIFFGVLVAAEYWFVFQAALPGSPGSVVGQTLVAASGCLCPGASGYWWSRCAGATVRRAAFVIALGASIAGLLASPYIFFISLWCSTAWAFASYLFVATRLVRGRGESRFHFSLAQLFGLFGVLAAHFAAWRLSFQWMLEEYSRLPTTHPASCFVCTAAAKGHPRIVHSEAWQAASGATFRVNDQLCTLKAFELLLASISPRVHRQCRWAYNRVGPRVAALLFHPLLADVGYFLLKPLEWCARACLIVAIPGQPRLVHDLYRAASDRQSDARKAAEPQPPGMNGRQSRHPGSPNAAIVPIFTSKSRANRPQRRRAFRVHFCPIIQLSRQHDTGEPRARLPAATPAQQFTTEEPADVQEDFGSGCDLGHSCSRCLGCSTIVGSAPAY